MGITGPRIRNAAQASFFAVLCFIVLYTASGAVNGPAPQFAFVFTQAPRWDARATLTGGERFPAGARLMFRAGAQTRPLLPSFAATADAAVSFDGKHVLFAGKAKAGDPWQVWEVALAGGAPRRVTSAGEDCIRPLYLPDEMVVYARRTLRGYQLEIAPLAGGKPLRLTYNPGSHVPDAVLADGRVLYEAPFPAEDSVARDLFTVYTDGTGVETHRCDHGPDRHGASQLESGDIVFQTGTVLARFTSSHANQVTLTLPPGEYAGPVAEVVRGEWLVSYRVGAGKPFAICRVRPGQASVAPVVQGFQPVLVRPRPVPPRFPSALGNREGANLLCLNVYTSKTAHIPAATAAQVRVWSLLENGSPVRLGQAGVESDGSFYLQVPSERPLRFELLDKAGRTVAAESGWFWARKGEQRVCVGCHAGPERAPENAVPQVLVRTQTPDRIGFAAHEGDAK